MRTFIEWIPDNTTPAIQPMIDSESSFQQIKAEIRRCVRDSLSFIQTHKDEEDRVEFNAYGFQIGVWRTRINTMEKLHLGYKSSWEKEYYEINLSRVDDLAEMLYKHRGSGGVTR